MDLYERFKAFADQEGLLPRGEPVLAAVSGGIDSMVLLYLLVRLRDERSFRLGVAHIHHGLRGKAADADARFVEEAARRFGCGFHLRRVDAAAAATGGVSLEQAARELRYRALDQIRSDGRYARVAVAHTADDQSETVLLNFLRGAGVRGLAGMPARRGAIVRPLLFASRQTIVGYARERGIRYRDDVTNEDVRFRRNRIRQELLPYLQQHFNPDIRRLLVRTAGLFRGYEVDLQRRAEQMLADVTLLQDQYKIVLDLEAFLGYFKLIRSYAIYLILDNLKLGRSVLDQNRTEALLGLIERRRIGSRFPLGRGWEVLVDRGAIVFQKQAVAAGEVEVKADREVPIPQFGLVFKSRLLSHLPPNWSTDCRYVEVVDYDAVGEQLRMRPFRAGDRFWPLNAPGFKKVGDFFTDQKVPLHLRPHVPILEGSQGIVWVCGFRMDHRFRVTERTRRFLQIEIVKAPPWMTWPFRDSKKEDSQS